MKRNYRVVNFVLFCSVAGAIALTASAFVACGGLNPDEFLDLAQTCQNPFLPILAFHWRTNPLYSRFWEIIYCNRINLLSTLLRC